MKTLEGNGDIKSDGNPRLLIAIPTKDRPEHIRYYLSEILPDAQKYQVDIGIYDSSDDDATKEIVDERIMQGYMNLSYKKCQMGLLEKIENIFFANNYDYIWMCGDNYVVCLEECFSAIKSEMEKGIDLILLTEECTEEYVEIVEAVSLMQNSSFADMTRMGNWIVQRGFFSRQAYKGYEKRYGGYIHCGAALERCASGVFRAVCIRSDFFKANPYGEGSGWVKRGIVFRVMERFVYMVQSLPEEYDVVKWTTVRSFMGMWLNENALWKWRARGFLDCAAVVKYRKMFWKYRHSSLFQAFLISLCSRKRAEARCDASDAEKNHSRQLYRHNCIYDCLIKLKLEGKSLESYFVTKQMHAVAVYGMGELGLLFCKELKGSSNVEIKYGMDQNYALERAGIPMRKLTDEILPVDVVVVTPIASLGAIREELHKKLDCPIVSIEEVVYSV